MIGKDHQYIIQRNTTAGYNATQTASLLINSPRMNRTCCSYLNGTSYRFLKYYLCRDVNLHAPSIDRIRIVLRTH